MPGSEKTPRTQPCYVRDMQIAANSVVAIHYTLKDDDGKIIDSNEGQAPMYYLQGAQNIVPGLENALAGKSEGDAVEATVSPEQGYGDYDENRTFEIPKSELGPNVVVQKGQALTMRAPDGSSTQVSILKVKMKTVILDGNHPLAGKNLHFSVKIDKVRKAKKDEIKHRHAHAPGAHGHAH